MAEQSVNGNGERIQRAAENALLQVLSRYGMVLIVTIALPVGAWMGIRLVSQLDKVAEAVSTLQTDMAVVKNDIGYLKQKGNP